jgi:hypothetical protein
VLNAVCDNHSAHNNPKQKILLAQKQDIAISQIAKGIYSEVSNSTWCDDTRLGYVEPLH